MNKDYIIALERQMEMLRYHDSPEGRKDFRLLPPIPTEQVKERETMRFAYSLMLISLAHAEPFFWPTTFCDLLESSSAVMPEWTLAPQAIPCKEGFFWFERPLRLSHSHIYALSWSTQKDRDTDRSMVYFHVFCRGEDAVPSTHMMWVTGESSASLMNRGEKFHKDVEWDEKVRYIAAALAFIQQRVLVTERHVAPRATQRRMPPEMKVEPLVRVIKLRRPMNQPPKHGGDGREYSCQWIVSGHWREQWYPSLNRHQPIWVWPYMKGPEDAPLKPPRARVFAVVR